MKKYSTQEYHINSRYNVANECLVDSTHRKLREMVIALRLLPGERLNESLLARELGVSRTPLRDAQNRLMMEGFLTLSVRRGFIRKPLDVKEILDLYDFRQHLEVAAVRLAVERATDKQLLELERFSHKDAEHNVNLAVDELVLLDEEFHERLITLTGNSEMRNSLRNINQRIRCLRWINTNGDSAEFQTPHREIVRMLRERNGQEAMRLMGEHVEHRLDQIVDKVEECYRRLNLTTD